MGRAGKVVVLGSGKLGSKVASFFFDANYEVTVVDNDPSSFDNLKRSFSGIKMLENFENIFATKQIDFTNVDYVLVLTPSDEVNVMISQIAKTEYNVSNVIVRLKNQSYVELVEDFGVKIIETTKLEFNNFLELFGEE